MPYDQTNRLLEKMSRGVGFLLERDLESLKGYRRKVSAGSAYYFSRAKGGWEGRKPVALTSRL